MTFATETARILFHQLPLDKQVEYSEWERRLATKNQMIQIDSVMRFGHVLEVVIRITDKIETAGCVSS